MINISGQEYEDFRPTIFFDEWYCVLTLEMILANAETIIMSTMLWEGSPAKEIEGELEIPNPNSLYDDSSDWGRVWEGESGDGDGDVGV